MRPRPYPALCAPRPRAAAQLQGPAAEFYKSALLLLSYQPLEKMVPAAAATLAFDLGIAALVGKGVYNFGELLQQPVIGLLESTGAEWLATLLRVFNAGDIEQYEELISSFRAKLEGQPALVTNAGFLKEKIALMSLMELVFAHVGPSADHALSFELVAQRTKLPVDQVCARAPGAVPVGRCGRSATLTRDAPPRTRSPAQVELLLMRAMSLELVRGEIDQVEQLVTVTWVQPRVLTHAQVANMSQLLQTWTVQVQDTLSFLEAEAPEFGHDANF